MVSEKIEQLEFEILVFTESLVRSLGAEFIKDDKDKLLKPIDIEESDLKIINDISKNRLNSQLNDNKKVYIIFNDDTVNFLCDLKDDQFSINLDTENSLIKFISNDRKYSFTIIIQ